MSIASAKDRAFLDAVFEPVVRATRFIEELCARTDALHGPETRFHGLLAPSISHEGYSKPSYSYWDDYFALSAWRNCEYLAREIGDREIAAHAKAQGRGFRRQSDPLDPHDRGGDGDEPDPRIGRSRRRRPDLDLDRLRALPGRRRPSGGIDRADLRSRRRAPRGDMRARIRGKLLAV